MAYNKVFTTLRIRDSYNRTKSKKVALVTTDATQAETDAALVAAAFQNAIDGHIDAAFVTGVEEYAGSPVAGSNVDTGVTVSCQLAGRPEKAALKWPTPKATTLNPDGTLDLTDGLVQAIEALFVTATPAIATLSDGETIDGFLSGSLDK